MARIRNMGTSTMRFGEGIIASGSIATPSHAFAPDVAIVSSGTLEFSASPHVQKAIRILSDDSDREISFQSANPAIEIGKIHATPGMSLIVSGSNSLDLQSGIVLINSGGAASSLDPTDFADTSFFVSGTIGSRSTATKGTSVFGGDTFVSGNLYVADSAGMYTDKIRRYSDSDNTTKILLNDELLKFYAGHSSNDIMRIGDTNYGDDTNLFVSGAIGSKDTGTKGTSTFGGDLQVSGTLYSDLGGDFDGDVNVRGSTSTIVSNGIIVGSNTDTAIERSSVSVRAHGSGNRDVKGVLRAFAGTSPSLTLGTETNVELKIQQNNNSKIVLDTAGNIGIDKATPSSPIHFGSLSTFDDDMYVLQDLHVTGSINLSSLALNTGFSVTEGNIYVQKTNANPGLVLIHSASSLTGNPDPSQSQKIFGEISFAGSNDTANNLAIGASISAITEGTWNMTNDRPTALVFKTTKDGTAVNTEVMRLDNAGNLGIGTNDPRFNLHLEATGSGARPRLALINRSNSIQAYDQVASLMFGAVANSDYDTSNRIVAQIDAVAEENYDITGGSLSYKTAIGFKTVGSTGGLTDAAVITGDKELWIDTITAYDDDIQTEKIQWRNNTVNMAIGDPESYNERIEISGSINYVQFVKSNIFIDGQEADIQAQPNRVHFNPDGDTNFELRLGNDISVGSDSNHYISGSIGSKGTSTKGTAVFGGDVVVSGSFYAKQRSITLSKDNSSDTQIRFQRFTASGGNNTPGVNNHFIAPADGRLIYAIIRCQSAANGTDVAFHKNVDGQPSPNSTATDTVNINIDTAHKSFTASFTDAASFNAGDILGVSVNPTSAPGDFNVTCVWEFDFVS